MKTGSSSRAVATVVALSSAIAFACGHCDEDRIAAVYNYALAQRTVALKHKIIFFAWDCSVPLSDDSRQIILLLGDARPVSIRAARGCRCRLRRWPLLLRRIVTARRPLRPR